MIQLNTRYVRKAPNGDETLSIARNEAELKYHQSLEDEGYVYSEVKVTRAPQEPCASCEG